MEDNDKAIMVVNIGLGLVFNNNKTLKQGLFCRKRENGLWIDILSLSITFLTKLLFLLFGLFLFHDVLLSNFLLFVPQLFSISFS